MKQLLIDCILGALVIIVCVCFIIFLISIGYINEI